MVSHPALLRGFSVGHGPLIVKRTDDDFIEGVLRDVKEPALVSLLASRAVDADEAGTLKLFQPVHRIYHLALFEVVCDRPGQPRLDPAEIDSAGMVIRRVASARGSGAFGEAWMKNDRGPVGWRGLSSTVAARQDPDPAQRHLPDQGSAALNQRVAEIVHKDGVYAEDVIQLYVAAPDVCAAAGRTLVFGLIPTASAETGDPAIVEDPYDDDEIAAQVPRFLRAGIAASISELQDNYYTYESAAATAKAPGYEFSEASVPALDEPASGDSSSLRRSKEMHGFLAMLKVLAIQLDAFGTSSEAKKLRDALSAVELDFSGTTVTADVFLANAADALVMSPGSGTAVQMPSTWPTIATGDANAIQAAFGKILQKRFASFTPRTTRFDDPAARYRMYGFIRVRRDDGCPPDLVWSEPSQPYLVAPWFDTSSTPPVLVRLPPLNRSNIKKLKPNVSFVVPKNLFNILSCNSPDDLIKGNGKDCGDGGIDWICGFNIPIITLCAFIVLNIFLTLFNIIFFWLPFIKICFPLPKKLAELPSPEAP